MTRGERNNNPGNIRHLGGGQKWQGESKTQTDHDFCQFDDVRYGIRALAKTLLTYQDSHGLRTIKDIINRWAPPNENDTGAYVNAVANDCKLLPTDDIDLHKASSLETLCKAIIRHENGEVIYTDSQIQSAVQLATGGNMADQTVTISVPDSTVPQPKAGITSSESWGTIIGMLFPILQVVQGNMPPEQGAILVTVVASIYTAARTVVKAAHSMGYAKAVPDLPAAPAATGAPK